ncbi:DUF4879 domain-containing protein [Luteibacter flocculans]|uniref:DUF4879 domain-containing protein n=1 Tax=Luteibacter flocculans TaxID=2780091 RepID=A0ABY4T2G6_9GAMM|nr:DUF4879 domain-containing protein [Luteibacter flocculans]URL59132.1 DUF4879 domain-containing protein [Luteibacter flocculans]
MKLFLTAAATLACSLMGSDCLANNLSNVQVVAVESPNGGREYLSPWSSSTARDHGGGWIKVTVEEIGYGNNQRATLLGYSLRETDTQRLCNVGGYAGLCRRGGSIIGYRRTWEVRGLDGGNFEYMVIPNGIGPTRRVHLTIR